MKKISIIGAGLGPLTATAEGLAAMGRAELVIGARRMLSLFATLNKPGIEALSREDTARAVASSAAERIAVLLSGDTGFYSAAEGLCEELEEYEVEVLPGVSSLNYFFAKLKRPWQDTALISCHGRDGNLADAVRRNRLTFALTGGNVSELSHALCACGFGELQATVGENLGTKGERILHMKVSELATADISSLSVLLLENPEFDGRVRTGIPDGEFLRGGVPMTKSEVRAAIMSKLALKPADACLDIGCGTGSVTVEMALSAYRGRVWAIDREKEAVELTRANCAAFHVGNVTAIEGSAPEALSSLPAIDAAFIGGSGGRMEQIVPALVAANPRVRIAAAAIALQSVNAAIRAFEANGLAPEVIQLSVARSKETAGLHMMTALNPIFIVSGGGNG